MTGACFVKPVSTGGERVLAVTSVANQLLVLVNRDFELQIAVYRVQEERYQPLRNISLRGLTPELVTDMTSCPRHRRLYLSDSSNQLVHVYDLEGTEVGRWPVRGVPRSLSVTLAANLLVTCWGLTNSLAELSSDGGRCVREIVLPPEVEYPRHGVQLSDAQFVVCVAFHGLYQVWVVGADGKPTHRFGGKLHGCDVKRCPYQLAVDSDARSIFVADTETRRVDVLTLQCVHRLSDKPSTPCRIHFDRRTQRLFLAERESDLKAIQL